MDKGQIILKKKNEIPKSGIGFTKPKSTIPCFSIFCMLRTTILI